MWRKWKFSYQESHISLIALQCSIQITMLTARPFTILCVPIQTLYKCIFMRGTGCKNFIYGPSWMHEGLMREGDLGSSCIFYEVITAWSTLSNNNKDWTQPCFQVSLKSHIFFVNSFCTSSNKNQQKMYQKQMSQIIQTIQWHIVVSMKFIRLFL